MMNISKTYIFESMHIGKYRVQAVLKHKMYEQFWCETPANQLLRVSFYLTT